MKVEVPGDAAQVARRGAEILAESVQAAVAERGICRLALSGGATPWAMLRLFAKADLPWHAVHLFQVDERVAPPGDPQRNLTHLRECLAAAPLRPTQLHPMPVERADLAAAAADYARELSGAADPPPSLDLVHLGLGADGHTASLVPGDPVCNVDDRDVAVTRGPYQGYRRMTLTFRALRRAARVLWLVTGAAKGPALARLRAGDPTIPAGRVPRARAILLVDRAADAAAAAGASRDAQAEEPDGEGRHRGTGGMDREAWDERYRATDLAWGVEPNRFVAQVLGNREPSGRALDLACGEGRNAIWLAKRGWSVVGVDFSEVAIERARRLAAAAGAEVEWVLADVAEYQAARGAFALVVVSYLQVPEAERRAVLARAAAALAPGGELFMIGHALRNLTEGVGGPRHPAVLWDPDQLAAELRAVGLRVERCEEVRRPVEVEGEQREAIDVLAQARRPASSGT